MTWANLIRGWVVAGLALASVPAMAADKVEELTLDYAYYSPVSLVLKNKGWLEEELKKDGIKVKWVLSLGSNKALEFLNARSLDFGSSAGAAALLARINGNPVKSVYVYSKPEWTALVATKDSPIQKVQDLKGKRIAATRGTDPHIFLLRTLGAYGLTEKDVKVVLLQHQDGKMALLKGDVDVWAGLDPPDGAGRAGRRRPAVLPQRRHQHLGRAEHPRGFRRRPSRAGRQGDPGL